MDRPIRRQDRAMTEEEARSLLERGEYGVLSCASGEGIPYGVPVSYVMMNGDIYFHGAQSGRKTDCLAAQPMVSFCVVGRTQPVCEPPGFSTLYESVIVRGTAAPVADEGEKKAALLALCGKYFPGHTAQAEEYVGADIAKTAVCRIAVRTITGKHKKPKA